MPVWAIILIVIGVILFVLLPAFILNFAGAMTVKMLKRCDVSKFNVKGMDISFYKNGPIHPMAEKGLEYLKSLPMEDVYITSKDGYKLHAYLIKNPNMTTNKWFIGMHGFKSYALREYAPYAKKYFEMGFNLLLPDERAHSKSEGKYLCMGFKEKYDALGWGEFLINREGEDIKIMYQGISMGAATVCLLSGLDLPKQVIGIISDCSYTSIQDELNCMIQKKHKVWTAPFFWVIDAYLRIFVHVSLYDETPIQAVKKAKVPMVFFHGKVDQIVPSEFAPRLYEACGSNRKNMLVSTNANHAETVGYEQDKYYDLIKETFNLE